MSPTIPDGSYVVYMGFKKIRLRKGGLYLFRHRSLGVMVKRMVRDLGHNYWFEGDNPSTISSAEIGGVVKEDIIGQVLMSISEGSILPKGHFI